MNIGIGWIVGMASCLGGFLWLGGHLEQLFVPQEYLIIFGAAMGTLVAANKWRNLKSMFRAFLRIFLPSHGGRASNLGLLCLMFELLQRIKRDGALSIESDISDPHQSELFAKYPTVLKSPRLIEFITDYFTMMMDGTVTLGQLESVMAQEIEVMNQEALEPSESIATLADSMPAFGIVAAIVGVIHTLASIKLGKSPGGIGGSIAIRDKTAFSFALTANNITDVAYQSHLSRLKYTALNTVSGRMGVFDMGRSINLKINIPFHYNLK